MKIRDIIAKTSTGAFYADSHFTKTGHNIIEICEVKNTDLRSDIFIKRNLYKCSECDFISGDFEKYKIIFNV